MTMEIIIGEEKHIPEIIELFKEFMEFHKKIDPRFPLSKYATKEFEKHLRELMKSEDSRILVAIDNEHVIGFMTARIATYTPLWEREKYGAIDTLAVTAGYRRMRVGEQMLYKIYQWFRSQQIDRVEVAVAAANEVGYPFWRKHGFKEFIHRLYYDLK
jgi:ribosomal protein S18 acetylase RimI-like enzyme